MSRQLRVPRVGLSLFTLGRTAWLLGMIALLSGAIPVQAGVFSPGCTAGIGDATALQAAVVTAGGNGQDDTITLVAGCTYTLTATLVVNADAGHPLTIEGSGATLSGSSARAIFNIFGASVVTLNDTTIANGLGGSGGGIYSEGTLIVKGSTFTNNTATVFGGGIYNAGALTVSNTTFTSNAASTTALGGAIYNAANKSSTIARSTFKDNTAFQGAAVHNAGGTLTVDASVFDHNIASDLGGGIRSAGSSGNTTVRSSLFINNQAVSNGGAYYNSVGVVTIENSTFSGNQATNGGGLYVFSGIITLTGDTIAGNSATTSGGGIYVNSQTVTLSNVLVAANSAPTAPDASGAFISNGYNLVGNSSGTTGLVASDLTGAAATPLNLGALADNGGPTRTMALLPGSVAVDQGNPASLNNGFDQRGVGYARVATSRIDIGAFEVQPACPTFPASIANGDTTALIAAMNCANRTAGSEVINLAANGGYALTSRNPSTVYALHPGGSFNGLPYVNDASLSGALTINGNGATLTRSAAAHVFRLLEVAGGGNLTLSNLTLSSGWNDYGAGIYNAGTLSVKNAIISSNFGTQGVGIYNLNSLMVSQSTFSSNVADGPIIDAYGGALANGADGTATISLSTFSDNQSINYGGAIYNVGSMTVSASTFDHNDAIGIFTSPVEGWGGGIANAGVLTVTRSTFDGNRAYALGGGLYNTGTLTVDNSTFNDNQVFSSSASFGQGGALYNSGSATLTSTTITGNAARNAGGGIKGSVTLANTLVAVNFSTTTSQDDISGAVTSQGYNLVSSSTGATGLGATDLTGASAQPLTLGPLANNGGPTQTIALITGSTAINGGDPAYGGSPAYDQRGVGFPRVRGGRIDIGAYEAPLGNTLDIQLTLQGRPAAPNDAYVVIVQVTLNPSAGGSPVVSGDYESDTSGHVVIADVPTGDFSLTVKGTHTLATTQSVTLVTGSNSVVTPALKEGDADGSNGVTISDFSILAASFGKVSGQIGFDARADFNGDGAVTIADFSLLAGSFGQVGAP